MNKIGTREVALGGVLAMHLCKALDSILNATKKKNRK